MPFQQALITVFFAALSVVAQAQSADTRLQLVPSAGIAAEGGPGTMWVNPANLAYDPDLRWGAFFSRHHSQEPMAFAITGGFRGISGAVTHTRNLEGIGDWSIDFATSVKLPQRLAIGGMLRWRLLEDEKNFVAFDAALAWRPVPWIGVGAVTRAIGGPGIEGIAPSTTGVGVALRPAGRTVTLGADFEYRLGDIHPYVFVGSARVRPVRGLYLRGSVDSTLHFGVGLEFYLGAAGAGVHARFQPGDALPVWTAWIGNDEPGEALFTPDNRVGSANIDELPEYQPQSGLFRPADPSWLDVLEELDRARSERIRGVVITLQPVKMGPARAYELRTAIEELEAAGKMVAVYLYGSPDDNTYFAASAASHVWLHPAADLALDGLHRELTHFGGLMGDLGVGAQVVRRDNYKTMAEPFTDAAPTEAELEQSERLLDDVFEVFVAAIAEGRAKAPMTVKEWVNTGPHTADHALAMGMVDALLYPDQVDRALWAAHQRRIRVTALDRLPQPTSAWDSPRQIAVVYIDHTIAPGKSQPAGLLAPATTGSRTIVSQLARARHDGAVRAVVIRVDTPGGSAFASEEIWREVQHLRESGKPVVVSMGEVAASGGYYVAADADAIVTTPVSVTGSIGAVAYKINLEGFLRRLGVVSVGLTRGDHADMWSPMRPWNEGEMATAQTLIDATYARFRMRVAEGRKFTDETIDQVAGGRVWSGTRAVELGLADETGGLIEAVRRARALAGIPENVEVATVTYREPRPLLSVLTTDLALGPFMPIATAIAMKTRPVAVPTSLLPPGTAAIMTVARHPEERVWMLDPWLMAMDGHR